MKTAVVSPEAPSARHHHLVFAIGAVALVAAVAFIYRDAFRSYFFNDDFQWLQGARIFALGNIFHLEHYNHFYRPVIEVYFYVGRQAFGCNAFPFHVASVGIHLICTLLVYLFARALTGRQALAAVAAVFFAVQPGHAEAVAWVGAITDLMPALWFLLAMWAHLLFLQGRGARFYAISLAAFVLCLLTHESSATLLPMMLALEATVLWERARRTDAGRRAIGASRPEGRNLRRRFQALAWDDDWSPARAVLRYAPFALLLVGSLAINYIVNSRSYLVREGHYLFGWHAVPHVIHYLITLWVGTRDVVSQVLMIAVLAVLLLRGTPRVRFFVIWMLVTIAPASFFTWNNVSRYLYLPAAGFSMLAAEGVMWVERFVSVHASRRAARTVVMALALVLAVRFALFAQKVPAGFRAQTRPYERYADAVRKAAPAPSQGSLVHLTAADVYGIPALYWDAAAEVATCGPDVHVVVR